MFGGILVIHAPRPPTPPTDRLVVGEAGVVQVTKCPHVNNTDLI